jgi:hypothetical protein
MILELRGERRRLRAGILEDGLGRGRWSSVRFSCFAMN